MGNDGILANATVIAHLYSRHLMHIFVMLLYPREFRKR
jgi:hypothetical protein